MKQTRFIMGMPIIIELHASTLDQSIFEKAFKYFKEVDAKFSTYKETSEITKINKGKTSESNISSDMRLIFKLAQQTKKETQGYFDIYRNGTYDPSGIVKGWAIQNAAKIIKSNNVKDFFIECGGDIQIGGRNKGKNWKIGIKNPFDQSQIIKIISVYNKGVATSGNYIRGEHIYNPKTSQYISEIISITVIGPNIYEADRFATAAFAMGKHGINFIEKLNKFEGYMIDKNGIATMTSGFDKYVFKNN